MLTLDQICSVTTGAVRVWEEAGWFAFSRFTALQQEVLHRRGFTPREHASAGVRLEYTTRGGAMEFSYAVTPGSGREYYGIEVAVNGLGAKHIFAETGTHEGQLTFAVPPSETPVRVTVYFPGLSRLRIREVRLPADFAPVPRKRRYLAVGDSITQGYDCYHPNMSYVNLLADALDAQVVNQAIGGDYFWPENLDPALPFVPDFITVAYGTNDWKLELLNEQAVSAYLDKLTAIYPGVPVMVLLPIWRQIGKELRNGIDLPRGRQIIAQAAGGRRDVHVIDCSPFVPMVPECFYDGILHPNDLGFLWYARGLEPAVKAALGL